MFITDRFITITDLYHAVYSRRGNTIARNRNYATVNRSSRNVTTVNRNANSKYENSRRDVADNNNSRRYDNNKSVNRNSDRNSQYLIEMTAEDIIQTKTESVEIIQKEIIQE